jgi:hypothetical protein
VADQQQTDDSNPPTDIELERLKMYQDLFKHMMTFCSAAILLASAVSGALFLPKPGSELNLGPLLAFSIFHLAAGALFAMLGLTGVLRDIDSAIDGRTGHPSYLRGMLWASVITSLVGLLLFSYFAVLNLSPYMFSS